MGSHPEVIGTLFFCPYEQRFCFLLCSVEGQTVDVETGMKFLLGLPVTDLVLYRLILHWRPTHYFIHEDQLTPTKCSSPIFHRWEKPCYDFCSVKGCDAAASANGEGAI